MTWVQHGREEILVANLGDRYCAMDNVCSHSGGSLADGYLDGAIVICPLHGWEYDVTTGCCTHIPDECLKTYEVRVQDGTIFIAVRLSGQGTAPDIEPLQEGIGEDTGNRGTFPSVEAPGPQ